ncbi:unnamed protein product [Brassica napus]|uniref:(rape) hypothetical protein n=1 Tax=Brassica napus TaxID=3708 RepID=A0A816RUT8_BRANA|nr:unnamed protein product [Brassica napus]
MSSSFALFLLNLSYAGRFKEVDVVKEKGLDFASHLNFNLAHILLSRIINLNLILIEMSVLYPFFLAIFRFKDEPQVTKYVKIASTLPDKSVRDVAMRCKWMTQKRRKGEEHSATNVNYRKAVDLPPKLNMFSTVPQQNATYVMNPMCQSARVPFEGASDAVMELLRQNAQAFSQISSNLSAFKPQDNISLFYLARNNISSILNDMKQMAGISSRMSPLPVSINNDLVSMLMTSTRRISCQMIRLLFNGAYSPFDREVSFVPQI